MRLISLGLLLAAVAGCQRATTHTYEYRPADDIASANERIDWARRMKQRLLEVDPIERQIEAHLQQDPRVQSARFAIPVSFAEFDTSPLPGISFATVFTTHEPITDEQAAELLQAACNAGGMSAELRYLQFDRDGNTWALRNGWINPLAEENPDLSPLRAE